jgi:hypothetical protein
MEKLLSTRRAREFVSSGEWIDESDFIHFLDDLINQGYKVNLSDDTLLKKLESERIEPSIPIHEIVNLLYRQIESMVESQEYLQPPESPDGVHVLHGRIGYGRILKINPTLNKIAWAGLGIFATALSIARLDRLFIISVAQNFRDIFQALKSSWENLDDPKEKLVFELIFMLQSKLSVVNYDALAKKDYNNAYGYLAPSFEEILKAITSYEHPEQLPPLWKELSHEQLKDDLLKVLQELKRREILKEKNMQWSIVF